MKRILFSIMCISLINDCFACEEVEGKYNGTVTSLMITSQNGYLGFVKFLLKESAGVNIKKADNVGTALTISAAKADDSIDNHNENANDRPQLFNDTERRILPYLIFLALPAILGGVKIAFQRQHPMVGKPPVIKQLYDKNGNMIPIDAFKGYIVIVNSWESIKDLKYRYDYQSKYKKLFSDPLIVSYFLYIGDNVDKVIKDIENDNIKIPSPFFLDIDNQFEEHFKEQRLYGGFVIDENGIVQSVPREHFSSTPFDYTCKVLKKLLKSNKMNVHNVNQKAIPAEDNYENDHSFAVYTNVNKGTAVDAKFIMQTGKWVQWAQKGCLSAVQAALDNGAEVNVKDRYGQTILFIIAEKGYTEIVKLLLGKGVDINAKRTDDDRTSLHLAAEKGYTEIVKLLLENGADANIRCKYSLAEIDLAKEYNGVQIFDKVNGGLTALHLAAIKGHTEVVKLLLEKGADVNAKKIDDGNTALHIAASRGYTEIVKLLLKNGADVNIKSKSDSTALFWSRGYVSIVQLLKEAGAKE